MHSIFQGAQCLLGEGTLNARRINHAEICRSAERAAYVAISLREMKISAEPSQRDV